MRGRGLGVVLATVLLVACSPRVPFAAPAAAVVDGHDISMRTYTDRLEVSRHRDPLAGLEGALPTPAPPKRLEDFTIEQLVREELIRQEVERRGIRVTESEVSTRVATLRTQAGPGAFDAALSRNGFTAESFRAFQRALLREVALAKAMARERAQAADDALRQGRAFASVAGQWSDDPGTALRAGEVGWIVPQDLPEAELGDAVRDLSPGGRTGVVSTRRGFVIASVLERRGETLHLFVILVLAPSVELYSSESRPAWFDRWVKARRAQLAAAGRIVLRVGSQARG